MLKKSFTRVHHFKFFDFDSICFSTMRFDELKSDRQNIVFESINQDEMHFKQFEQIGKARIEIYKKTVDFLMIRLTWTNKDLKNYFATTQQPRRHKPISLKCQRVTEFLKIMAYCSRNGRTISWYWIHHVRDIKILNWDIKISNCERLQNFNSSNLQAFWQELRMKRQIVGEVFRVYKIFVSPCAIL